MRDEQELHIRTVKHETWIIRGRPGRREPPVCPLCVNDFTEPSPQEFLKADQEPGWKKKLLRMLKIGLLALPVVTVLW